MKWNEREDRESKDRWWCVGGRSCLLAAGLRLTLVHWTRTSCVITEIHRVLHSPQSCTMSTPLCAPWEREESPDTPGSGHQLPLMHLNGTGAPVFTINGWWSILNSTRAALRVLPSHKKPTSPQMKSLQLWQKVGLVRVTFLRQCPCAELWYLGRRPGDCCALFFTVRGLDVRPSAASGSAGLPRPESAMSSYPTTHTRTHTHTDRTRCDRFNL